MALTPATSRKTMQLDILQLGKLNFLTTSNTPIISSLVLTANGDGTTTFNSISSLINYYYTSISVPGQTILTAGNTNGILNISSMSSELYLSTNSDGSALNIGIPSLTSTIASTLNFALASTLNKVSQALPSSLFNLLTYPNIASTINYQGNKGNVYLSTISTGANVTLFSSFQYNFSNFTKYLNPNGSSRMFIEYYPNFIFSPVITPSSISSLTLYPEGNSSIKNIISLSSHMMYVTNNSNIPIIPSGEQQYINITSSYPYGASSIMNTRPLSNSFIQPMQFEMDTLALLANSNSLFSLVHYVSDGTATLKSIGGNDVFRSGFERPSTFINNNINDKNSVFVRITNSGNQS